MYWTLFNWGFSRKNTIQIFIFWRGYVKSAHTSLAYLVVGQEKDVSLFLDTDSSRLRNKYTTFSQPKTHPFLRGLFQKCTCDDKRGFKILEKWCYLLWTAPNGETTMPNFPSWHICYTHLWFQRFQNVSSYHPM